MDTVVVLPTYNEVASLRAVVDGIVEAGTGVLVVDDASPDGTGALADELAETHPAVAVLHRHGKEGLGRAYAAGFRRAIDLGADVVCAMDSDLSHDPAELRRLLAAVDAGADLALGSRYVAGGSYDGLPWPRFLLSRAGNVYASLLLRLGVKDSTSGFRAYRASLLQAVEPQTAVSSGYAFQIEMVLRAKRAGARIVEVPINFRARSTGASKLSGAVVLEALWLVTRWAVVGWRRSRPGGR